MNNFIIPQGTPVELDGRTVISDNDHTVEFPIHIARTMDNIKLESERTLYGGKENLLRFETENGEITIDPKYLHFIH